MTTLPGAPIRLTRAFLLALSISLPRLAAAQAYRPTFDNPTGKELVAVYLGSSTCGPCRAPEMPRILDSMKVTLQERAGAEGRQFRAVIVALDWSPDSGLVLAREDGTWDEINTGRNWFGMGATQFFWSDSTSSPSLPQIVVYEQNMTMGARVEVGPAHILKRLIGAEAIARWVRQGSPTT